MKKILFFFGTRPEAIKLCPLARELQKRGLYVRLCCTGQHRELLSGVLTPFDLSPDILYTLPSGLSLSALFSRVFSDAVATLEKERPALVITQGDTLSAAAASLASFYAKLPVAHIEAGLRTYEKNPYPEEAHRRIIAPLAEYHFAPTERARGNLLAEGIPASRIFVTGNTGLDALRYTQREDFTHPALSHGRLFLCTLHRRESLGVPAAGVFRALRALAKSHPADTVLFCLHKNPAARAPALASLSGIPNLLLCDAPPPSEFVNLLSRAHLVLTDSGGVSEEASFLGIPTLVLREHTERTEGVDAGGLFPVGTETAKILATANTLLFDPALYKKAANSPCPFGDGQASRRIADCLCKLSFT